MSGFLEWDVEGAVVTLLEAFRPVTVLPARLQATLLEKTAVLQLPRGSVLFDQGAESKSVYAVLSGRIALQRHGCNGDRRAVCFVTPGCMCCCVTALDGGPYPATASAATPATVACIPIDLFREMMQTQPVFAETAMRQIGLQLRLSQCEGTPSGNARAKLASKILSAVAQFGNDVPLTRRELSEMAGTTVETAIRLTRDFEESGWVSLSRGQIRVRDAKALRVVADALETEPR